MQDLIRKALSNGMFLPSEEFKELIQVVASLRITYVRKYMDFGDHLMLYEEIAPKEIVVSTDSQSIYFINGSDRLGLWASHCTLSRDSLRWSGLLRHALTVKGGTHWRYQLYEDTGTAPGGYPSVYVQPLAGIYEQSWLDKTDPTVVQLR